MSALAAIGAGVAAWLGWLLGVSSRARSRPLGQPRCVGAIEAAREGRLHASPSGRLVSLTPPPPAIYERCPYCRADLIGWLESGHWVLTDAGRRHAETVRLAESSRRLAP